MECQLCEQPTGSCTAEKSRIQIQHRFLFPQIDCIIIARNPKFVLSPHNRTGLGGSVVGSGCRNAKDHPFADEGAFYIGVLPDPEGAVGHLNCWRTIRCSSRSVQLWASLPGCRYRLVVEEEPIGQKAHPDSPQGEWIPVCFFYLRKKGRNFL